MVEEIGVKIGGRQPAYIAVGRRWGAGAEAECAGSACAVSSGGEVRGPARLELLEGPEDVAEGAEVGRFCLRLLMSVNNWDGEEG